MMQDPPREQLDALFALYKQGNLNVVLEQAEALVKSFPRSFSLWQLLGAANFGLKRLDQAVQAFTEACNLQPDNAAALINFGAMLQAQGRLEQAVAAYQRAIAIKPDHAVAYSNLGSALFIQGKLDDAINACQRAIAIEPENAEAYFNLGNALNSRKNVKEAIVAYQRAIAINPDHADAHSNLGAALRDQGRLEEAIAAYQRAITVKPSFAEAHNNLGVALEDVGMLDQAITAYQRAITIKPDYADAYSNLGAALFDYGKLDEAITACQRAVAIKPNHPGAHYNFGNALRYQGKLQEAIAAYQHAIAIKPDHANALSNLGIVLCDQGKLHDAIAAYQRAIALNPNHADAHWNLSLALLTEGRFTPGWSEHEWRWQCKGLVRPRLSGKPLWLGAPSLKDRTILLWGEQGLGDQIQFVRYASLISELGARVVLEVSDPLVRVLGNLSGVNKVVGASTPVPDSEFDFHCPLMSLPLALGTELSTIPDVPSLTAHITNIPRWAERVPPEMPKIGIAWSGNPNHKNDRNRSVALSQLAPILTPNATWISLQKEVRDADRPAFDALGGIQHFGEQLADFLDTASLCEQCDLVISVDTSIAHLAATLGRPVWLLLPFAADWRWLRDRDDSPWYPKMKLYRQQQIGDWEGVFQRVKVDLQTWLTQR